MIDETTPTVLRCNFAREVLRSTALVAVCAMAALASAQQRPCCGNYETLPRFGQGGNLTDESALGSIQQVRVIVPEGASVAIWNGTGFQPAGDTSALIDMRVGAVYRLKITNIPRHEGTEVFPSIELLNRLHAPGDKADQFPVIVEIPDSDLEQAIDGKMVTRIVYLENPETAMPYRQKAFEQPFFDVRPDDDPLQAARRLGRAFALVRLGSRIPGVDELQNGLGVGTVAEAGQPPEHFPWQNVRLPNDEYIYDGGDQLWKTTVAADWSLPGLDPQDTIVHYDTLSGERVVKESNRIQIYAPRFAAVRQIAGAIAASSFDAPRTTRVDLENVEYSQDERTSTTLQNIQPRRANNTQGSSGLIHSTRGVTVDNVWVPKGMSRVLKAYEDFQIVRSGVLENAENARLGIRIQAAQTWDSDLQVQVTEGKVKPLVVRDALISAETVMDGRPNRPMIRLFKVASASYAHPGDEIEFTIRFDNIGNELIGNVTIVDNLTNRLEYIPDSAECSKKSEFKTEPNTADSQTLRWEITDPLEAGDGGIIRFRCRVR